MSIIILAEKRFVNLHRRLFSYLRKNCFSGQKLTFEIYRIAFTAHHTVREPQGAQGGKYHTTGGAGTATAQGAGC